MSTAKKQINQLKSMLGQKSKKQKTKVQVIAKLPQPSRRRNNRRRGAVRNVRPPLGGSSIRGATNRRQMVVSEDEYVGEVAPSSLFATTRYPINPGQATTFPWLSTIAQNFNKYRFISLEFYYKREVSEFATDGQTGKIILSIDPDASDPQPSTKQQAEDFQMKMDGMPCENFGVVAIMSELNKQDSYYVRVGAQPANTDIKTYDCGNLDVSSQSTTSATGNCGELRVRYTVVLHSPILSSANQQPTFNGLDYFNTSGDTSAADPFGTTANWTQESGSSTIDFYTTTPTQQQALNGVYVPGGTNKYLTLPNVTGNFLLRLVWTGSGIAAVPTVTASGGATVVGLNQGFFLSGGTTAEISCYVNTIFDNTYSNTINRVTVGGLTSMANSYVYISIVQAPPAFALSSGRSGSLNLSSETIASELQLLKKKINNISLQLQGCDSDFIEDEQKCPSPTKSNSSLSKSTISVLTDILSRAK